MARNSSLELVCGNGASGTGTPSAAQIGSQPSPGCQSTRRSRRNGRAHERVVLLVRALSRGRILPAGRESIEEPANHAHVLAHRSVAFGLAPRDREDRLVRALPPRGRARTGREQHDRVGIRGGDLLPESDDGPVDRGGEVAEECVPVDGPAVDRFLPRGDVVGPAEDLDHVVAGAAEQLLECDLQ